ncbi:unnamed protein product [Fusarium graminearum]|nr:unnamed protein product [Fusarium graminearum]
MADFAFNWQGVAYKTRRQNRRPNALLIYVRDHLGVVVGEILPAGLSLQTGQEISPNEFEFDPDYHSYIGTQENIGLVVSKINGNMPSFHRLIGSRIDKVIRRLPIDDNVLDRIFFYREYVSEGHQHN